VLAVAARTVIVGAVAAVALVSVTAIADVPPVAAVVALVVVGVPALGRRVLLVLVAGLGGGRRRGGRLADGVVDGDGDADRAASLTAQRVADDRREAPFEHALRKLVRDREERGVRHQGQRLAALDPVLVLRLDTLPSALTEELFQYSWPHCGKIGRYVSHRARSLMGPTNVWFWEKVRM